MLVVGGQAAAGAGSGAVPGSAWFSVDRRFNPEEDLEQELARLTDMINEVADAAGATVDIEVLQEQPSGSTDQTHPAAETLAHCINAVEGAAPSFQMCPGVLDTRWYSQSASRPSPTAAAACIVDGPPSTSTRPPRAAAPPSTRSSRITCRTEPSG